MPTTAPSSASESVGHPLDLVALVPVPLMLCHDGRVTAANAAALDLLGVADLGELTSALANGTMIGAADSQRLWQRRDALCATSDTTRVDVPVVRPDGRALLVEWTVRQLPDERAFLHVLVDRTDLVAARDGLAEAESHQREIVSALAEGVIVVDAHGVCTDANPAAAALLWLPSTDLLIGAPADAMPLVGDDGEPIDPATHPVRRALSAGVRMEHELVRVRFGGQTRSMRVSITVLERYGHDGPTGAAITFSDITDELAAAAALSASERRFRELAAQAPVGIFETDAEGRCTYVNDRLCEFTGRVPADMLDDRWVSAIHPDDVAAVTEQWFSAVASATPLTIEYRYRRPDGRIVPVHAEAAPLVDVHGSVAGWLGTATDLTAQTALRDDLARNERRFRQLAERSPDLVVRYDLAACRFEYLSPACRVLLGVAPDAVYLDPALFHRHVHPDDRITSAQMLRSDAPPLCEMRVIGPDSTVRTLEARTVIEVDGAGRPVAVEAVIRDVTDAARRRARLQNLAHRDELTGLPNRRAMMDSLPARLAAGDCAVLFVDLDGFKQVNDRLGHDAGDEVLMIVAELLGASIRGTDEAVRLGGDEFVVLTTPAGAPIIAGRLLGALASPIALSSGETAKIGASIGVARYEGGTESPEELLGRADAAMYEAKRRGRGQVVVAS